MTGQWRQYYSNERQQSALAIEQQLKLALQLSQNQIPVNTGTHFQTRYKKPWQVIFAMNNSTASSTVG